MADFWWGSPCLTCRKWAVSFLGWERGSSDVSSPSYKDIDPIMRAPPSRLHLDLSISFLNTLTLRVRDSTSDFMGDTVKSTAPFSCVKARAYGKLNSPSQNISSSSFTCSWVKSFPKLHKHETQNPFGQLLLLCLFHCKSAPKPYPCSRSLHWGSFIRFLVICASKLLSPSIQWLVLRCKALRITSPCSETFSVSPLPTELGHTKDPRWPFQLIFLVYHTYWRNGNPFQYSCLGKSHGQRSLAGYSPWSRKESDTTKAA